jgi:transcription termination factor Rho
MKPEHGQTLAGGVETRAAEPAEQFLGTMRSQRHTYGQPENE